MTKVGPQGYAAQEKLFGYATKKRRAPALPTEDNTPEGLRSLLEANRHYREVPWPEPFNRTTHHLHLGDARLHMHESAWDRTVGT